MPLRHICYQDIVPAEVRESLIGLYQSVFCVPEYFSLYHAGKKLHAIAIYSDRPDPDHVICYSISGKEALILNELFEIDGQSLNYLVTFLFSNYPKLHTIHINKFKPGLEIFPYPYKIWGASHDNVVTLPETIAEYRSQLGKRTRANLSNYYNKLKREFDDFSFTIATTENIDPAVISTIIAMHRTRMLSKKTTSAIDTNHEENIIQFAGKYGIAGTITIHDRIAAGTICYVVGKHCYAEVIAHDPAYSKYSIGRVCIYLLIEALIEKGVIFFHMGFGEADYKNKMLSVKYDVSSASIFRTKFHEITGQIKHVSKLRIIKAYKNMIKYNYILRLKEILSQKIKTE
jgi:hypothetical protein